jgi:hypothetical protein
MRATVYISSTPYIAKRTNMAALRSTTWHLAPTSSSDSKKGCCVEKIVEIAGARVDLSIP